MKCDRCKDDYAVWDMVHTSAKYTDPILGYKDLLGGGKLLFCEKCYPIVAKKQKGVKAEEVGDLILTSVMIEQIRESIK
jgi:hypothetical protein